MSSAPRTGKAFTLIELLVVISIVALLSGVVLSSLNAAREKGRLGAAKHFATQVEHVAGEQAVGMWDFDDCTGTGVRDRSGFSNNGNIPNASMWSTDTYSTQGCAITTSSGQFVTIANTSSLNPSGDFTLSAWIKNSNQLNSTSDAYTVLGKYVDAVTPGYEFTVRGGSYNGLFFRFESPQSDTTAATPLQGTLSDGKWHFIAVTYTTGLVTLYVDGAKVGSRAVSGTIANTAPLTIGTSGTGGSWPFSGSIDTVRVYAKTLSASDIESLYAFDAPKFRVADRMK